MTTLVARLKGIVAELVRRHRIVVWYDPAGTLRDCVSAALPDGTELHVHEGSYLALRVAFEEANPKLERPSVLYVRRSREEPSWLRDLELAGCCRELGMRQLLAEAFHLNLDSGLREVLDGPVAARLAAAWDDLLPSDSLSITDLRRALLAAALEMRHRPTLEDIVLDYVSGTGAEARLARAGLLPELHALLRGESGWPSASADGLSRQSVAAALLLSEATGRGGLSTEGLAKVLPRTSNRAQWAAWADKWRRLHSQTFEAMSDEVDRAYGVRSRMKGPMAASVQSFRSVDDVVLADIEARVVGGDIESALEPARQRAQSYWAQAARAAGAIQPWDAVLAALEVRLGTAKAAQELAGRAEWSLADLLARFSNPEDGWWRIDDAYRRLDAHRNRLPASLGTSLGTAASRAYFDWVDSLGVAAARCLNKGEWAVAGWRSQGAIVSEAVVKPGRTAIILADALRFDLAMSLYGRLEERGLKLAEHRSLAALPSVTQVGMAAILGAGEVEAVIRDGRLFPQVNGAVLLGRAERLAAFKLRFPKAGAVELSDVRQGRSIPKAETLIVYMQDIDEQGDFLPQVGSDHFDVLVKEIVEGIDTLLKSGYRSVLVIPDHGFLLLPEGCPPRVLPVKVGADTARGRRFLVGRPPEVEGAVRTTLDRIGWRSTAAVAFPMGASVFGIAGEVPRYMHGGPSLQETALLALTAERVSTANPVGVRLVEPSHIDTVWPRFVLEGDAGGELMSEPRRVRVTVRSDGKVVGESEVVTVADRDRVQVKVRLQEYGSSVEISVEDFATREVLETKSLPVALPAGYEDMEL